MIRSCFFLCLIIGAFAQFPQPGLNEEEFYKDVMATNPNCQCDLDCSKLLYAIDEILENNSTESIQYNIFLTDWYRYKIDFQIANSNAEKALEDIQRNLQNYQITPSEIQKLEQQQIEIQRAISEGRLKDIEAAVSAYNINNVNVLNETDSPYEDYGNTNKTVGKEVENNEHDQYDLKSKKRTNRITRQVDVTSSFAALASAIADMDSWVASHGKELERRNLLRELERAETSKNHDQVEDALNHYASYKREKEDLEFQVHDELHNIDSMLASKSLPPRDRMELESEMNSLKDSLNRDNRSGVQTKLEIWQARKKDLMNHLDDSQKVIDQIISRLSLVAMLQIDPSSRKGSEANRYLNQLQDAIRNGNPNVGSYAVEQFDHYIAEKTTWERQLKKKKAKFQQTLNDSGPNLSISRRKALQNQIQALEDAMDEEDISGMQAIYSQSSDNLLMDSWANSSDSNFYSG